ncbi:Cupin region protein [Gloeomargarita lithophora Alchichica-D10]|uniref:Cupin region protein n=1 Tax=Gloeomargarita lithophora Alchichica-D10 TaxID=1188229 RepID=A0A1J0AFM7_9CYAN|nr:hypothetical protein [Gloeomargarita lithophora]APB34707.1 Cupin region protein [Gloeomargarita lithophora Alchichica-D10]
MHWLVDNHSNILPLATKPWRPYRGTYRLYRFLTDVEDILAATPDDQERLGLICPLLARLIQDSFWLELPDLTPDPETGWAIQTLYDEPEFPLTVQVVAWNPGSVSPIHNHGTWGVVAMLSGQERHPLWQRTAEHSERVINHAELTLGAGDMVAFLPSAIHSLHTLGSEPSMSLNVYGETDFRRRWEFDPVHHTATLF